jgi:phage tail protein X
MATLYMTRDGDMIDAICFKHYGRSDKTTERVLEANPRLADYGPRLPPGILVNLPDLPPPEEEKTVRIWG